MSGRRGAFTLLELVVALAIAALVATLAYAALRAGTDAGVRLGSFQRTTARQALLRALVSDALRHLADAGSAAESAFVIDRSVGVDGTPIAGVRFLSRGIATPMGAGEVWRVALTPTAAGLRFRAEPRDHPNAGTLVALLPDVRGMEIRALRLADSAWVDDWHSPTALPIAVALRFSGATGAKLGSVLVVATTADAAP